MTIRTTKLLNVTGNSLIGACQPHWGVSTLNIHIYSYSYRYVKFFIVTLESYKYTDLGLYECRNWRKFICKLYSELKVFDFWGSVFQIKESKKTKTKKIQKTTTRQHVNVVRRLFDRYRAETRWRKSRIWGCFANVHFAHNHSVIKFKLLM